MIDQFFYTKKELNYFKKVLRKAKKKPFFNHTRKLRKLTTKFMINSQAYMSIFRSPFPTLLFFGINKNGINIMRENEILNYKKKLKNCNLSELQLHAQLILENFEKARLFELKGSQSINFSDTSYLSLNADGFKKKGLKSYSATEKIISKLKEIIQKEEGCSDNFSELIYIMGREYYRSLHNLNVTSPSYSKAHLHNLFMDYFRLQSEIFSLLFNRNIALHNDEIFSSLSFFIRKLIQDFFPLPKKCFSVHYKHLKKEYQKKIEMILDQLKSALNVSNFNMIFTDLAEYKHNIPFRDMFLNDSDFILEKFENKLRLIDTLGCFPFIIGDHWKEITDNLYHYYTNIIEFSKEIANMKQKDYSHKIDQFSNELKLPKYVIEKIITRYYPNLLQKMYFGKKKEKKRE